MILIVDDKQENIYSLKITLEQHGFDTDTALSGEEALKKVLKNNYALIILDVQMPVMDGFEVAEAITGLKKTKDVPIIFLSAVNTHKKFITKGFASGAVDYLTKPVDPDILILKVRNFYRMYEQTQALKKAEAALMATVSELQIILEALPQIAFTSNNKGEVDYVNRQWFAFARDKQSFPQTPEGHPPLQQLWRQNIAAGQPVETEVAIQKLEDGQFYYHLLKATPVVVGGYTTRWVGTFTSIHEQKMLNETLEMKVAARTKELIEINRELEISNNDLQQFSSVASHDLQEPLRKIQYFGHIIKDSGGLKDKMANYLDKMLKSAARMSNLITDLLSFSSLSQPDAFTVTDINAIVKDILMDLELLILEKEAQLAIDKLPQLEVIPGLIRQLFQNLISNALKFTKPGQAPHIIIKAEFIAVPTIDSAAMPSGAYCRIRVADNGIGFDEMYVEKIFTIFQRLNARAEYEGTGIGLAIARKIVDLHNGLIAARSTPGEGATFYVILPVRQNHAHISQKEDHLVATTLP